MNRRKAQRLFDVEVDEISTVDRSANQHADLVIAKRAEDDGMDEIFDADGNLVEDITTLEHGEIVFDADGQPCGAYLVEGEEIPEELAPHLEVDEDEEEDVDEPQLVGVGKRGGPSLGDQVLQELSKALNDGDRDQVIAKMASTVEAYQRQAHEALTLVEKMADERELEEFTEIAKGYGLPGDPAVLGSILKSAASTMAPTQLRELDRLLTAQGEMYQEIGSAGSAATSEIMGQVEAMALQAVGKSDGGVTKEQAITAMFDANPDAYDQYCAEQLTR